MYTLVCICLGVACEYGLRKNRARKKRYLNYNIQKRGTQSRLKISNNILGYLFYPKKRILDFSSESLGKAWVYKYLTCNLRFPGESVDYFGDFNRCQVEASRSGRSSSCKYEMKKQHMWCFIAEKRAFHVDNQLARSIPRDIYDFDSHFHF